MEFKGHDWIELVYHFNRTIDIANLIEPGLSLKEEDEALFPLQAFIRNQVICDREHKALVLEACKSFLKALHAAKYQTNDDRSMWLTLLTMEDEEKFINYFSHLLPMMWD
jgi:hypothetical protein